MKAAMMAQPWGARVQGLKKAYVEVKSRAQTQEHAMAWGERNVRARALTEARAAADNSHISLVRAVPH